VALTKEKRELLADKFFDLGNLTFAGLIIGQLISGQPFNTALSIGGLVAVVLFYLIGMSL
jgi:hypothetical protein